MSEYAGLPAGVPIEQFIQALTGQLDRAQQAMAMKARLRNLPLTFAVKDITLDLRAFVQVVGSVVQVQPAGPGDADASTLHIAFTTITKPMIEENALQFAHEPDEPTLKEAMGDEISDEEQRRLEWIGVQTISQLRELKQRAGAQTIQKLSNVPAERLQAALARASAPHITRIVRDMRDAPAINSGDANSTNGGFTPLMRIRGHNLRLPLQRPTVRLAGENLAVLDATEKEIVVAPLAHQLELGGMLEVEVEPGVVTSFALPQPTLALALAQAREGAT